MKKTIFLIAALSFAATIYPQGIPKINYENPRVKRPIGLSLNLGGPTIIASASLDCFVMPVLSIETGGGITGYYLGSKYHFEGNEKSKTTLYVGFIFNIMPVSTSNEWPSGGSDVSNSWTIPTRETSYGIYLPVGYNIIYKNGYTFSSEIAYCSINKEFISFPFWFSLKFGYHFKSRNDKIANKYNVEPLHL